MYTTINNIKALKLIEIDSDFEPQIIKFIESAEKYIDNYTNRTFETIEGVRLYSGNGYRTLNINDATEVTKVEIGGYYGDDFKEETDIILLPANYEEDGIPIRAIYLKENWFPKGIHNVRVTGKFGYSDEAPADIREATTRLVSLMINYGTQGNLEGVTSEKIGDYAVTYNDNTKEEMKTIKGILDSYVYFAL